MYIRALSDSIEWNPLAPPFPFLIFLSVSIGDPADAIQTDPIGKSIRYLLILFTDYFYWRWDVGLLDYWHRWSLHNILDESLCDLWQGLWVRDVGDCLDRCFYHYSCRSRLLDRDYTSHLSWSGKDRLSLEDWIAWGYYFLLGSHDGTYWFFDWNRNILPDSAWRHEYLWLVRAWLCLWLN